MIDFVIHDPYFDQWGSIVGFGSIVLALGATLFWIGCGCLFRAGHRLPALVLAVAGGVLVAGAVGGALWLDVLQPWRHNGSVIVLGVPMGIPDLLLLPEDAFSWPILGAALTVMGSGMAAIRPVAG